MQSTPAEIHARKIAAAEARIQAAVDAAGEKVSPEALAYAAGCMVGWGGAAQTMSAYTNAWDYQPNDRLLRIERDGQSALFCLVQAERAEAALRHARAA